jgi:hypothetical protein
VRRDPRGTLTALCAAIELPFDPVMLQWAPGQHAEDGVWAPHWYGAIFKTTEFAPPDDGKVELPGQLQAIAEAARPYYERMRAFKIG